MASPSALARIRVHPQVPGWRWPLAGLAGLLAALTGWLLGRWPAALAGRPWRVSVEWMPALGLWMDLSLDGLSLLFALLVAGIGALVVAYSIPYMAEERGLGRYYGSLLIFALAMLGLVTAANLLLLFMFWELTSVSSYLLIGFRHEEKKAQDSALQALLVTATGGLALLAGFALIRQVYGTFDLAAILAQPGLLRSHPYYRWVLALVLLGACTKSAQFPWHFWLPNAMVAPTPVSAYLHSATMVKAGIYLLARLSPVLGGSLEWQVALLGVGTVTMLLGAGQALLCRDVKAILAYTTVSSLGMMVALLGLGGAEAVQAVLVALVAHALYKGALFLVAGIIDHETGTRDVELLGGLAGHMPVVAGLAALAGLSMAGLPPTLGFVAKELGYGACLGVAALGRPLVLTFAAASACNVALAVVLGHRVFWGEAHGPWPRKPHGSSWLLVLPPALLAALSCLAGLAPGALSEAVHTGVELLQAEGHAHALQLWPGWSPALAVSGLSLAAGGGLYALWPRLLARSRRRRPRVSAGAAYDWLVQVGLPGAAARLTQAVQNGSLRIYLVVILGVAVLLVGGTLLRGGVLAQPSAVGHEFGPSELVMAGLLIAAALSVALASTRLGAIASLGAVGALVTLLYVRFSAPDLALTQLLIETLTVILLLLVFHFLPPFFEEQVSRWRAALEVGAAAAVGVLMAALVLVANRVQFAPSVSHYYLNHSLELGHGRNVVNVILVDFRGFDTLGEITVLATATVGLWALLRLRRKKE